MNGFLHIGPLQWTLDFSDTLSVRDADRAYEGFWFDEDATARPVSLSEMSVSFRREARCIPAEAPLYCGGKNWALWEQGDELVICSGYYEQEFAGVYCRLNRRAKSADVFVDPARSTDGVSSLRYPLDQILSWGMLAECGGVILHSAVAVRDGLSWVFIGRSGAGKTTLSELCHSNGWKILNDDRTMVFPRDRQYCAAGTPWHGSGRFAEALERPLGGVFVIEKAARNHVESMSAEEIKYALLDVAAIPWFDDAWAQGALDAADSLMKKVPFYRFSFRRDQDAVQALETFCDQNVGALL
jgi:hypothetical protein